MTKNREMMNEKELTELAELFKVFGDSSRIKILYALFETEMGVGDIADTIDMTISAVSHQLRILKQNHLVKSRRNGKSIIYSLDDDHVLTLMLQGLDHVRERQA